MPASFNGAEASVDSQRKSALDALAQYGRRGLESAVVAQVEGNRVQNNAGKANAAFGGKLNVGAAGLAELAGTGAAGREAYATNGRQGAAFMASENAAAQSVNGNFFNQVRQAVPLARTGADQIVDEYRANYAAKQAQIQAEADRQNQALEQARIQAQIDREAMEQDAALFQIERYGPPITNTSLWANRVAAAKQAKAALAARRIALTSQRNR